MIDNQNGVKGRTNNEAAIRRRIWKIHELEKEKHELARRKEEIKRLKRISRSPEPRRIKKRSVSRDTFV